MKKLLLFVTIMTTAGFIHAQTWQYHWANQLGNTSDLDESIIIKVDNEDHVYAAGQYYGNLIAGEFSLPVPDGDGRNLFVAQYEGDGTMNWAIEISGGGGAGAPGVNDLLNDIAVDNDNNLYVIGNVGSNATIDGVAVGNPSNANFIAKISSSGDLLWVKTADADYMNDAFKTLHIDSDGTVYLAGQTGPSGSAWYAIDGVLLNGAETFTDDNPSFIAKISSDGTVEWVNSIEGPFPDHIALSAEGDFYLSARQGSGAFDSGVYLIRLNGETLEPIWTRHAQHNNNDFNDRDLGLHVRADGTLVHFFKTGNDDPLDFGDGVAVGGDYNFFGLLYHVDADGQTIGAYQLVDQFNVEGVFFNDLPISTDGFGVIDDDTFYIVGELQNTAQLTNGNTFNPDPWFFGNGAINPNDALVLKVDLELNILEAAYQTGSGRQTHRSVAVFANGDAAVGGWHLNPEAPPGPFGDGTTIFGDTQFSDFSASRNYHVIRVTTGEESALSTLQEVAQSMRLFPNPAIDLCILEFGDLPKGGMVNLTDITGKMVRQINLSKGAIRHEIDLSNLSNGLYIVNLQSGETILSEKLVISR